MSKNKEKDDFWGEAGNVNFPYFSFKEVGDKVRGVYVGKYVSNSKYGYQQENYVLVKKDGSKIVVSGRSPSIKKDPKSLRIMYGMDKIPLGAVIGFIFEEERENDFGENLTKIINLKYMGEVDKATAEKFNAVFNMADVAKAQTDVEKVKGSGVTSADEIPFDDEEGEDDDEESDDDDEDSDDDDSEEEDDDEESDDDDEESDDEDEDESEDEDDEDSDDEDEDEEEEEKPVKKASKKEVKKKKKSKK